ncbi:uncharacterized protein LOC131946572 isoform X2 [Physella acuta]|uniref:uncharacterized protein LOC131946572 isoform X2 n=1 Tax=Physella acuta TaxID=109671 RepID=UPI0027DD77E4|nr:uncharacterized protein LOC131946572 isoform X2 [Physella acuta]
MNPLIFIGLFLAVSVSGEYCTYHRTFGTITYEYCNWGCCYSIIYPCCDTPYYADVPFVAGMALTSVGLLLGIAGACVRRLRRVRRLRHVQTTVQNTASGNQQVFSILAAQENSGVANTDYVNTSAVNTGYMGPPAYNTNYSTAFSNSGYTHTASATT